MYHCVLLTEEGEGEKGREGEGGEGGGEGGVEGEEGTEGQTKKKKKKKKKKAAAENGGDGKPVTGQIFIVHCVGGSKAPPVLYSSYRTVFERNCAV